MEKVRGKISLGYGTENCDQESKLFLYKKYMLPTPAH